MNFTALPDPTEPAFVLFMAALGAFIGATIGRARRRDRERVRELAENLAYVATATSLIVHVILLLVELVS